MLFPALIGCSSENRATLEQAGCELQPDKITGKDLNLIARIILVWLLLSVGLFSPPATGGMGKEEVLDLYNQADASFKKGNELLEKSPKEAKVYFQKSLVYFQAIGDGARIENSKLRFNIGNCFFRMGDLGRAILNYRRAEELSPGDPRLQANIALARNICEANSGKTYHMSNHPAFPSLYYECNPAFRIWLLPAVAVLFWCCFGFFLRHRKNWLRRLVMTCGILVVLSCSLLLLEMRNLHKESGVIVAKNAIARKGNNMAFEPSFPETLASGTEFELLERRAGWYYIRLLSGKRGWVPNSSAELVNH